MKIDFNQTLKDIDGKKMTVNDERDTVARFFQALARSKKGQILDADHRIATDMIQDFFEEFFKDQDKDLMLKNVALRSLLGSYLDERDIPGEEKLKRLDLAIKINNTKEPVNLSIDEIKVIRDLIAKNYRSPLVVGGAWKLLDT